MTPTKSHLDLAESKVIKQSGLGGYKYIKGQEFCPCADPDIKIYTVDTTLKIIKDIKNADNWSKTSKRKYIKGGVFTCKFTLTDQDIINFGGPASIA